MLLSVPLKIVDLNLLSQKQLLEVFLIFQRLPLIFVKLSTAWPKDNTNLLPGTELFFP